jgi:hypothetical protein
MVDCARSGVSLGQFLNATLKNNVKTREWYKNNME